MIARAEAIGLTADKSARISGRVSPALIAEAKARTGLTSDTDLLEYALANVAVDDGFLDAFDAIQGMIDPDLDFGI